MTLTTFLQQTLQNPILWWFFFGPLALIVLDLITGVIAAAGQNQFSAQKVSAFLSNDLLKYLAVCVIVLICFLAGGLAQATAIATVLGMSALSISIVASITSNIQEILPRVPASLQPEVAAASQTVLHDVNQLASQPALVPPPKAFSGFLSPAASPSGPSKGSRLSLPTKPPTSAVSSSVAQSLSGIASQLNTTPVASPESASIPVDKASTAPYPAVDTSLLTTTATGATKVSGASFTYPKNL